MNLREEINKLKEEGYSQQWSAGKTIGVNTKADIVLRMERILTNKMFISNIKTSKKNWLDLNLEEVLKKDLEFIRNLKV